ncbi:hypothetical protein [Streptomyces sp. NPDC048606]|uniref:hypothetical protein n=1 Tax=Streptomyces sp. NPDC048606 TaxID=3154726 RepID=UPI0034474435
MIDTPLTGTTVLPLRRAAHRMAPGRGGQRPSGTRAMAAPPTSFALGGAEGQAALIVANARAQRPAPATAGAAS